MATLAVWCPTDGVLGMVAPLALAAAAGAALVIDLDPAGPGYKGAGSLRQLVDDGPRLDDLRPGRRGIAVLRNGGITGDEAGDVLEALANGWPNTVLRLPREAPSERWRTVPVIPLLPSGLTFPLSRAAVYQQIGWHEKAPGPAVTLPTPNRGAAGALLDGRLPATSRWVRAWRQVWELPWA